MPDSEFAKSCSELHLLEKGLTEADHSRRGNKSRQLESVVSHVHRSQYLLMTRQQAKSKFLEKAL
jgi:hypothetical protein